MGWSDPPVITSIVLAAITFFYLIATLLIWHATWQNTKATRQVLEASHRPYVGVADMRLAVDDLTGDLLLLAKVANVGSVPARTPTCWRLPKTAPASMCSTPIPKV